MAITSRYSKLGKKDETEKHVWKGFWNGHPVEFNRNFRGYNLSDAECDALCGGEQIEIHGLMQGGTQYSVKCSLHQDEYEGVNQEFMTVGVRADSTIPYDPDYTFEKRHEKPVFEDPDDEMIKDIYQEEEFALPNEDDMTVGSEIDATIRALQYPSVLQVAPPGNHPVYVPVFELLSEDKLQAAAARASMK